MKSFWSPDRFIITAAHHTVITLSHTHTHTRLHFRVIHLQSEAFVHLKVDRCIGEDRRPTISDSYLR